MPGIRIEIETALSVSKFQSHGSETMRVLVGLVLGVAIIFTDGSQALAKEPLYPGMVWINSDVLTPASPSDFVSLTYQGFSSKRTFDRRVNSWVNFNSHVFQARFSCGRESVSVVVNPEFSSQEAEIQANRFARMLGQLPIGSRKAIFEIWIHSGYQDAGGGNNSILVHTDYADKNMAFMEEVFIHESGHTSLDWDWAGVVNREKWNAAATADMGYLTEYAAKYPDREDVAESYGAFLLHELARTNPALGVEAGRIGLAIPNRLEYFRSLGPEFGPSRSGCVASSQPVKEVEVTLTPGKRTASLAQLSKGVSLAATPRFSTSGNFFSVKLDSNLKMGYKVKVFFGKGKLAKLLTRPVAKGGRITIKANVGSARKISVQNGSGKILASWRLSKLP
jgi:hypothetical protein